MSIFCDFEVGLSGRRFRRAVHQDMHDVELFMNRENTEKIFGKLDIGELIELSVLSICMINEDNKVLGFMSLNDYPNISGVDPADWEVWIRNMFQKYYLSRNTLFIHCSCCKDAVIDYFFEEALVSVFENDTYLLHIVLLVTADCNVDNLLQKQTFKKRRMFKHSTKLYDDSDDKALCMYVAMRDDFCPKLKIRMAVQEDNDDIVNILEETCPRLTDMYGQFYISEIVGYHPESKRKIIVAELDSSDRAVGVMCLNSDINYRKLQQIYELKPWYGLKKATPLEKEQNSRMNALLGVFGEPIMRGEWSPFDAIPKLDVMLENKHRQSNKTESVDEQENVGRVLFKENNPNEMEHVVYYDSNEFSDVLSFGSVAAHPSIDNLLDDDPFDYEIINIDKTLLIVPEALSYDVMVPDGMRFTKHRSSYEFAHEPVRKIKRKDDRHSKEQQKHRADHYNIFEGEPNAFSIELFGLRKDIDPRRAFDLLETSFEVMRDYDYCIIRVPSSDKSFPLLQHFCYVPTKPIICCNYSLYVVHRSSVLGKLRVRAAELTDIPAITKLLQNIQYKETICTIEYSILKQDNRLCYVFISGVSVIGLAILDTPEQISFLRRRFILEAHHCHQYHLPGQGLSVGFSSIKTMIAYPAFEAHYRFFARELMRLSGSQSLIWMTAYRCKWAFQRANSLASAMVPLLPRKTVTEVPPIPELRIMAFLDKKHLPFSSWFLDKKLTSVPLVSVSTRIVLVGSSRTALGFINGLMFDISNTYLSFTGVTLISPNGLPYSKQNNPAVESMFLKYRITSDSYMKSVPYSYYVNVINGSLSDINRAEKYITLTNGSKFHYDILILLLEKQFQHPDYLKPVMKNETNTREDCAVPHRLDIPRERIVPELANYETPPNVFIINDVFQANRALRFVKNGFQYDNESIVIVYGACIHAYCCITALLETKIPAKNIVFVEPFPDENRFKTRVSVFNNNYVDKTINELLEQLKIKVYRSYYFKSWTVCDEMVVEVEFLSTFHLVKLECAAFFYYGKRGIDTKAYLAVNKCGMGYDGGILIDHQFRTKDPCIYAAGPCTAYYRRYFATDKKQKYFDSVEVGYELGLQIRNEYDPLFTTKKKENRKSSVRFSSDMRSDTKTDTQTTYSTNRSSMTSESEKAIDKIPYFNRPRVIYCKLPGGLQFIEIRSPGKKLPHHYVHTLDYSGVVLQTFKNGYFKLHLTNDMIVDGVTCLTNEKYNLEILKNIHGLHSVVLNNVYLKFMTKKVDNFFDFFRSPWAYFLYHDEFDELFAMVKELLPKGVDYVCKVCMEKRGQAEGDTVAEALQKIRLSISSITPRDSTIKNEITKRFDATPHIQAITDYVIQWLADNEVIMNMYLQPYHRTEFILGIENHTAFRKKKTSITKLISNIL